MAKEIKTFEDAVKAAGYRFSKIRSDDNITFAQEKMHVLALIKKSRDLKKALPDSIYDALLQAASMGLSFNPTLAHCYLIPRRMRRRRDGESKSDYETVPFLAYASPSYRGLIHIPVAAGAIRFARAEVIYKDDHFKYFGPHHDVEYELKTSPDCQTEANAVGVFAAAKTIHGDPLSEYMPRDTVMKIKAMSEMKNSMMWNPEKFWTEGWKKAALRRFYKTLPNAPLALNHALEVLNTNEGIDPANMQHQQTTGAPAPEAIVLIEEDQVNTLHAMLIEAGKDSTFADRQLKRLAMTYNVDEISQLPVAKFSEALEKLKAGVERSS